VSLAIAKGLVLPSGSRFSIGAVPAAIAGVAPTLDFRPALERREIEAVSLTDKLTFTGGNQGTFVGSDGFIQRAQTNVPRFTHDPLTRRSLGMLLEGSGQNLLLRSEEFQITWAATRASVSVDAAVAPDGATTADKLVEDSSTNTHFIVQTLSFVSGTTYTVSVYGKADSAGRFLQIAFPATAFTNTRRPCFDFVTETATPATGTTAFIQKNPNGWYRCIANMTATVTTSAAINFGLSNVNTIGSANYTGDGSSGLFLSGAQINPGNLTSYIPTTTAAVTRTADSAIIDGTGVITGAYTMVEKPEGCAVVSGTNINLQNGFTVERVMIFPAALTAGQITAIRAAM
jgi:hypothetical protein